MSLIIFSYNNNPVSSSAPPPPPSYDYYLADEYTCAGSVCAAGPTNTNVLIAFPAGASVNTTGTKFYIPSSIAGYTYAPTSGGATPGAAVIMDTTMYSTCDAACIISGGGA